MILKVVRRRKQQAREGGRAGYLAQVSKRKKRREGAGQTQIPEIAALCRDESEQAGLGCT